MIPVDQNNLTRADIFFKKMVHYGKNPSCYYFIIRNIFSLGHFIFFLAMINDSS